MASVGRQRFGRVQAVLVAVSNFRANLAHSVRHGPGGCRQHDRAGCAPRSVRRSFVTAGREVRRARASNDRRISLGARARETADYTYDCRRRQRLARTSKTKKHDRTNVR